VLGVTFVSAGYRLAPQHVFPVGVDDAADAFAWVVQHSDGHGGDPQRVFVGGHSAGGQYAAPRAATAEWRRARGLSEHCARGGLPISGVYRFGSERGLSVRPRFLGPAGHAETAASPLLHLQPATCPPMFITRGSRDFPHPIAQARQRASMLQATGVSVQTEVLEGADHFEASVAWGDTGSGWPTRATAWMRQVQTQSTPSTGEPR
jgi:acetyl esterase/lipase